MFGYLSDMFHGLAYHLIQIILITGSISTKLQCEGSLTKLLGCKVVRGGGGGSMTEWLGHHTLYMYMSNTVDLIQLQKAIFQLVQMDYFLFRSMHFMVSACFENKP